MKERWEILADLTNKFNAKVVAEVGVSRGINASNWLKLCPGIEKMYLADISWEVFDSGLFQGYERKIRRLVANIDLLPDNLDLVFIDAGHYYKDVKNDIEVWFPKIRQGGIISGHDYMLENSPHTEVRLAVDEKFANVNLEKDTLENGHIYVWWHRKGIVRAL